MDDLIIYIGNMFKDQNSKKMNIKTLRRHTEPYIKQTGMMKQNLQPPAVDHFI